MIEPWAKQGFEWSSPTHDDVEIEALQTDVMRFMAILGFILSVIFALVQSLPFLPKQINPTLESYESLHTDITNLKNHIQTQLKILDEIKKEIGTLELLKSETLLKIQEITEDKSSIIAETQQIFKTLKSSQIQIATVEQHLEDKKESLRVLRGQVEQERQTLLKTQQRLDQVRHKILEIQFQAKPEQSVAEYNVRKKPERQEIKIEGRQENKAEPAKKKITEPVPPPQREGFTLKFKSDDALDRLVSNKFIEFYVFVGDLSWRIYLSNGIPQFKAHEKPDQYHEMDYITVPKLYIDGLKRIVAAHAQHTKIWGVKLPIALSHEIKRNIKGKQSGDVIIDGDGRVQLANAS